MTYQKVTGALMANSHPGSYCGQDAYNDMLIVEGYDRVQNNPVWGGGEISQTLDASYYKGAGTRNGKEREILAVEDEKGNVTETIVRRLTPLECERLQGYPDHYTDIGEWVDSKGKKHKDADSQRYKVLGNSIALPFWEWMAKRMVEQLGKENPTMGSLFSGIGGFELCYARAGCTPVWASEIEEFCIAVTKKHFPEEEEEEDG